MTLRLPCGRASVDYSGDFSEDDIVREALAALSQLVNSDIRLEALTEADLKPHAVRLARIIRSAK